MPRHIWSRKTVLRDLSVAYDQIQFSNFQFRTFFLMF